MIKCYNGVLEYNNRIRISMLKDYIKHAREHGTAEMQEPMSISCDDYSISLIMIVTYRGEGEFLLQIVWRDQDGDEFVNTVYIVECESNLIAGTYMYYFLCPLTGKKCLDLYFIANMWLGRKAFRNKYDCQRLSKWEREVDALHMEPPYRPYGKPVYRNKLTAYGIRCIKYEQKCERALSHLCRIFKHE